MRHFPGWRSWDELAPGYYRAAFSGRLKLSKRDQRESEVQRRFEPREERSDEGFGRLPPWVLFIQTTVFVTLNSFKYLRQGVGTPINELHGVIR